MSGSARPRLGWLQQHYEKVVLMVALLALLGSALFLFLQVYQERTALKMASWNQPTGQPKKAEALSATQLEAKGAALDKPFQMELGTRGVMASELRVSCVNLKCAKPIHIGATKCPFCGTPQPELKDPTKTDSDQDGIPDAWETEHGMNPLDPRDAAADWDNDGFSNLEEYRAGTKIRDTASHPDIASKLRVLGEVKENPFLLRFMGIMKMPSGLVFQLNLRTGRTHMKKIGEEVEGYKLQAYESASESPEKQDVVLLHDGRETIRLVKGNEQRKIELTATLIFLLDNKTNNVSIDKTFTLHDRENRLTQYKVIDIKPDAVKIREQTSGREFTVPPATPAEVEALGGSGVTDVKVKEKEPAPVQGMPKSGGLQRLLQDMQTMKPENAKRPK